MHKARLVRAEYRNMLLKPGLRKRLIEVLEEWLQAIWDGTANYRLPTGEYDEEVDPDDADSLINAIMDWYREEFNINRRYWNEQGIYEIPNYTRIKGKARVAFAQELRQTIAAYP